MKIGFAVLAVLSLVAGSLVMVSLRADPSEPDDSDGSKSGESIPANRVRPIVVNQTTNGTLRLLAYQEMSTDECRFRENADSVGTIFLYDREGPVLARYFEMPTDRPRKILDIKLTGVSPFLFAVDTNICFDLDLMRVVNVTDGYVMGAERMQERVSTRVEVTIPVGEERGNATWRPEPFSWRLIDTKVDRDNTTGARTGTLWFYDSRNAAVCQKSFSPTTESECIPYFLFPGPYRVAVELDRPAVQETVWHYEVETMRFTEAICDRGFMWEGICR